jgi:hypothetical protein
MHWLQNDRLGAGRDPFVGEVDGLVEAQRYAAGVDPWSCSLPRVAPSRIWSAVD